MEGIIIKNITIEELKRTAVGEGLILQGCGGDLADWVHGINKQLTLAGILQNGREFTDYYTFEYDGLTNILFSMDGVDLDTGKLAMWRLETHGRFSGAWLSDYLPNKFGVKLGELKPEPEPEKPAEPYKIKAYIDHPNNPDCPYDGLSISLPAKRETVEMLLENLRIKDIHNVKICEVCSVDDENYPDLGHLLNTAIENTGKVQSLDELNYLTVKIQAMTEKERDIFGANLQSKQHVASLAEMINLTENLDSYYLQPNCSAENYGEFLIMMAQDDPTGCFERLEKSDDAYDREFAVYITRLEKCVDHAKFAHLRAKEEDGFFTDYGYIRQELGVGEVYRGVQDIPPRHRISKPSLMETLAKNAQKSREQFGETAPSQNKEKGEIEL